MGMGFPRTAPKPFRPLAERVHARRCQLQDSDAELRENHLCSCRRALDLISSHAPQYTPTHHSGHCLSAGPFSSVYPKLPSKHSSDRGPISPDYFCFYLRKTPERIDYFLTSIPFLPISHRPIAGGPLGSSHLRSRSYRGQQ